MNKRILWIAASLVLLIALSGCAAANTNPQFIRQISATGQGTVYLTPDVAYINIGVRSVSENVNSALKENNAQAQKIAASLKELGVEEKDIQTTAFNVYPQTNFDPEGKEINKEYVVENTVYVTVRSLNNLGELLDKVVSSGANTINGIQFDVLNKAQATNEARKIAVENAKQQAKELAEAGGVQLGDLQSLNVYPVSGGPMPMYDSGKGGVGATVPVSAGQMVITMEANLSYEIH